MARLAERTLKEGNTLELQYKEQVLRAAMSHLIRTIGVEQNWMTNLSNFDAD